MKIRFRVDYRASKGWLAGEATAAPCPLVNRAVGLLSQAQGFVRCPFFPRGAEGGLAGCWASLNECGVAARRSSSARSSVRPGWSVSAQILSGHEEGVRVSCSAVRNIFSPSLTEKTSFYGGKSYSMNADFSSESGVRRPTRSSPSHKWLLSE